MIFSISPVVDLPVTKGMIINASAGALHDAPPS